MSSYSADNNYLPTLLKISSENHEGFQICFFNARSLNALKRDYFNHVFQNLKIDVVCVVETWFEEKFNDDVYSLHDFKLVRNDRKHTSGGGIAVYLKRNLEHKMVCASSIADKVEFMFLEISEGPLKMLIVCVYNPRKDNDLENLYDKLLEYSILYENVFLCGDLNIDMLRNDLQSKKLNDLFTCADLDVVNKEPTRFAQNSRPSLLDIVAVSNLAILNHFDQFSLPAISDHDMLFASLNIRFSKFVTPSFTYRDFKRIDMNALYEEASTLLWNSCWLGTDINEKLSSFESLINYLFDKYVPLKTVRFKRNRQPWFTDEVKSAIMERNRQYSKWKSDPSDQNWESYRVLRNRATVITRNSKRSYLHSKFHSRQSQKELWKNLKSIGVHGEATKECTLDVNDMNRHFLSATTNNLNPTYHIDPNLCVQFDEQFSFIGISELEVEKSLLSIKSNATGCDNISLRFIKLLLPYVIPPLTHIFNFSITTSKFPNNWKIANVNPIAKVNNPRSPNDFRPISILPALSKAFEKCLSNQIVAHLFSINCFLKINLVIKSTIVVPQLF